MYEVCKAQYESLPGVEAIYARARKFMAEHGNPGQWKTSYPSKELLLRDIAGGNLYLITENETVHGVFYFAIEDDPTYKVIYNGVWHSDRRYGVIHRIAGDGSGGILRTAVNFALRQIDHLRIDTHEDNYVMQRALNKLGFQACGTIYIEDGSARIAFDKLK